MEPIVLVPENRSRLVVSALQFMESRTQADNQAAFGSRMIGAEDRARHDQELGLLVQFIEHLLKTDGR